jgi:hypothetical protein
MNCREAQHQIFAERDSALETTQRAALDGHVAECADCRRIRDDLTAVFATWRTKVDHVAVPDVDREWYAVRRRIRGGVEPGVERTTSPRRSFLPWLTLPLGAAAALAVALFVTRAPDAPAPTPVSPGKARVARADSVEVPGNHASTMVFVDDKSGWLIVWANDSEKRG